MKRILIGCLLMVVFSFVPAFGADSIVKYPVKESLEIEKVKALFDDSIAFYWGAESHPAVSKKYGTFKTSKRTNGFMKDRSQACGWAMASALVALRDRAEREGGNAVINIVSNIKDNEDSSETAYTCLAGSVMVNVALKGTVVTLAE